MAKLVLFLADGTTLDIPLDRERISIGRRTGNDVSLPYPAVSGKHAVVVTMTTGSVLEDLGSTNGTFVNRKRIGKYFLHDRDTIDIGRQKLVYCTDVNAVRRTSDAGAASSSRRPFGRGTKRTGASGRCCRPDPAIGAS
jgi:pSer/pThr/pTyr-binding forkhead associated (FHA) protein